MSLPPTTSLDGTILWAAATIEFVGGLLVFRACLQAISRLLTLGSRLGLVEARLKIAEGAVAALGFKTAATLLKTLELRTWDAVGLFAAILALRTIIKTSLTWESRQLLPKRARAVARSPSP